ncbi:DUF503 domain-containing protein [Candidatus Latescibacterota bacterium]
MFVIVGEIELHLPESGSLKDKRQVIKSLKDRLRQRYNLSVAEVDHLELWQRSALGLAVVSNAADHADDVLAKAIRYIEEDLRVEVIGSSIERW